MKKRWILLILLLALAPLLLISGQSDWHLKRNQRNQLPQGKLKHLKTADYMDEGGRIWELQPQSKNVFHQPDQVSGPVANPYPNADGTLAFDPKNPNLKFLCRTEDGGSYEAILQPNGQYLTQGPKQGTYNYGHPSGFFGIMKHVIYDVIPHFVNAQYLSEKQ